MKLFSKKEKNTEVSAEQSAEVTEAIKSADEEKAEDELMETIRKRNPRKKKKLIRVIVIVVIIAAVAGGVIYFLNANKSAGIPMTTTTAARGDLEQTINSSGTVETENLKIYYADVAAPIGTLNIESGSTVSAGALLMAYDTEDLKLEKEKADLTASVTEKKLQTQLEEGVKNEVDFASSTLALNDYAGRIAELEAKIEQVHCMITSRKKWTADEGARLQDEIAELQTKKASVSKNDLKDEYDRDIEDREDEIRSHNTLELEDYLRQGEDQLAKLKELKTKSESTKDTSEKGILTGTAKSQIADDTKLAAVTAEEATLHLERASTGVNAEFGGIVTDVKVTKGAVTTRGTELFTIADTDNVKVVMKATKYDLESIAVGQLADITIAGHKYTGKVTKIDRMAKKSDNGTAVINAEIHIDKPDDFIYLGIEAKVIIHVAESKNTILLPVEVINTDKTGYYCYVIYNGLVERRDLKLGISSDTYTEVLEGIKEGDEVIKDTSMELVAGTQAVAMPEDGGMDSDTASDNSTSGNSASDNSTSEDEAK